MLDIGVYCVQLASFVFGGEKPMKIVAAGHLNADGADESTSATLLYSQGRTATLVTNLHLLIILLFHGSMAFSGNSDTAPERCPQVNENIL